MSSFWNNTHLLEMFLKWKKHIILITFIGTLLIGASTYLITPKYQSKAVLYPINLGTFSDENYTEQMMQIFQSRDIKDSLIRIYNLAEHYELDSTYEHFRSVMYYYLGKNISVSRTEFEAVEVKVLDTDPQVATDMVNTMIHFFNEKVKGMHAYKLKELMDVNRDKIKSLNKLKEKVNQRMQFLSKEYGIVNVEAQTQELSAVLYSSKTKPSEYKKAKQQMLNLEKYGNEYIDLSYQLERVLRKLTKLNVKYDGQLIEYTKHITYCHILSAPFPADEKYLPKRIPITVLGGLSLFILVLLTIGFIEKSRASKK